MSRELPATYTDRLVQQAIEVEVNKRTREVRSQLSRANAQLAKYKKMESQLKRSMEIAKGAESTAQKEAKRILDAKIKQLAAIEKDMRFAARDLEKNFARLSELAEMPVKKVITLSSTETGHYGNYTTGTLTRLGERIQRIKKNTNSTEEGKVEGRR